MLLVYFGGIFGVTDTGGATGAVNIGTAVAVDGPDIAAADTATPDTVAADDDNERRVHGIF